MSKGLAIIYDRASTQKQADNYTRQDVKRIGIEIARRFGYQTEAEPRFELKSGEELLNRKVMMEIIGDIEVGTTDSGQRIAAIIVPSFTRLSRDQDIVDGMYIKKVCKDHGVVVIDFNGKVYDFQNENDQDTAFLEFWFASREKRQILNTMLRGQKEKALQGKYMGGAAPFGYRIVFSGEVNRRGVMLRKREIDPEEAKLVCEIFELYCHISAMRVAATLNSQGKKLPIKMVKNSKKEESKKTQSRAFTTADIMRIVKNPLYAGWFRWNTRHHYGRDRVPSKYLRDFEPQIHFDPSLQIISQQLFNRAQFIRTERYGIPSRAVASQYPFSYVLKCLHCGSPLGGSTVRSSPAQPNYRQHSYRCNTHHDHPKQCPSGQHINAYPVASAIIPLVAKLIQDKTQLLKALEEAALEKVRQKTIDEIKERTQAELQNTKQQLDRLLDAIAEGTIGREEAREKAQELRDKKERLTMDLHSYDERENLQHELTQAIAWINGDLEQALWTMFKSKEKQKILGRIVRLIFKPHSVSVEGYYDETLKAYSSHPEKRKARIVDYALKDEFKDLDLRGLSGIRKLDESGENTRRTTETGKGRDDKIKIGVTTSSVAQA